MTSSRSLLLLVALLAACAALTHARATPLDAETCNKLMLEQGALENAGVEQNMAKGPEWAKANLIPDKIEQIRRFIELEELILFRCRSKTRVTLPPDPEDKENDQDKGKDQSKDQAKGGQDKDGEAKQETVVAKTPPASAATNAKSPPGKTDAKADSKATPKAEPKSEPKADPKKQKAQPPKKPDGDQAKAGDPKAQPKAKKDTPGAKPQAKAPTQSAPKAPPQPPPKAKVEDEPKAQPPPEPNPFGEPFGGATK